MEKVENAAYKISDLPRLKKKNLIWLNPLPNDKFLDRSKLKDLADDKMNVTEELKFVLGRVENIVGKRQTKGDPKGKICHG